MERLYSKRLTDKESIDEHIRDMTEIFNELPLMTVTHFNEEEQVIHPLASLLKAFSMVVTALEKKTTMSAMETVTKWLCHEECQMSNRSGDLAE